jgi:hypothetical protein
MRHAVFAGLLLALSACSKKEPPAPEPAPSVTSEPAPVVSAPAPEASASAAAAPDVPVEEDFEDEANLKVTSQTLDSQLDALEKEIKAN